MSSVRASTTVSSGHKGQSQAQVPLSSGGFQEALRTSEDPPLCCYQLGLPELWDTLWSPGQFWYWERSSPPWQKAPVVAALVVQHNDDSASPQLLLTTSLLLSAHSFL